MEYSKIVAISGLPGLFELVTSKTDGAIVRSLEDKSTRFVSSRIHNFSHLESIEVFTTEENVNLADILKAMEGGTEKLPDEKDAAALTHYFKRTYPKLDFDRVYNSDLRKMVKWFSVLKTNQVDFAAPPPVPDAPPEEEIEVKAAPVKAAPAPTAPKAEKKKVEEVEEVKKTDKKPAKASPVEKKKKEVKEKAAKKEKPAAKAKTTAKEKPAAKEKPVKKAAKKKK